MCLPRFYARLTKQCEMTLQRKICSKKKDPHMSLTGRFFSARGQQHDDER